MLDNVIIHHHHRLFVQKYVQK